jgi:sigma-54 dependent transcriptional regulator, acetoin dehydrogenase operon transcriptional activator AcoR
MQDREFGGEEPATQTRPHTSPSDEAACVLGIQWLTPEERFHPLQAEGVIGRSEGCTLRLDGLSISRCHARIEREGPLWLLRDLDSKNGCFINGQRREVAPLGPQDTVRLGDWVGVVCRIPYEALRSRCFFGELAPGLTFGAATLAVLSKVPALAASDLPIIILGETGTGKELLAQAIHALSRRPGELIAINCSTIPEALAEAELFGHKKGSFTGASDSAEGRIAGAQRGSLLLDEIVDLPLAIQTKLLRTLEDRTVIPVGGCQALAVDFRLLAATQEPLDLLVRSGTFRGDLYARLSGAQIHLPPLRQRREEVLRLLRSALHAALGRAPVFDSLFVESVCKYAWPYNVRELMQLARLLAVTNGPSFGLADLPARFTQSGNAEGQRRVRSSRRHLYLSRYAAELGRLKSALRSCQGNVTEAARLSGIPRHRARRLLEAEAAVVQAAPKI